MTFNGVYGGDRFPSRCNGAVLASACIAALFTPLLMCIPVNASTYFVDSARPDDSGTGMSWVAAKKTIQAAIDGSAPGDTILVKYGVYGIAVACSLTSDRRISSDDGTHNDIYSADPDSSLCTLTAAGTSRVLTIKGSAVTGSTYIRGFKIVGGIATNEGSDPNNPYGGGILIAEGADPNIEHCWITGNIAGTDYNGYGGGIACVNGGTDPAIRSCNISGNIATTVWFSYGGGIYCGDSTYVQIDHCDIMGNTASTNRVGHGGGICFKNADAWVFGNIISGNVASAEDGAGGNGGGVYIFGGTVDFWQNRVTYNTAAMGSAQQGSGGGIFCNSDASTTIRDNPDISHNVASANGRGFGGGIILAGGTVTGNVIAHNTASASSATTEYYRFGSGGGLRASGVGNAVKENIIRDNVASAYGEGWGGGMYFDSATIMHRNIFCFNTASASTVGYGGGTYSYNAAASELVNNTFYRNADKTGGAGSGYGSGVYHASGGVPDVVNNIFMSHDVALSDMLAVYSGVALTVTNNCFYNNAGGKYNVNVTSLNEQASDPRFTDPDSRDFTLMYDSPCIEEGSAAYPLPMDGGWIVDIGAIEYTGTRHKRAIASAGEYLFGGKVRAKVNVTALGTLSDIDMIVHPYEHHPLVGTGIRRWYDIDATGGGATFDLTLSYTEFELFPVDEEDISVWRWTGSAWDGPKTPSMRNLPDNWLTVSSQTALSDWIMTGPEGPTGIDDGDQTPARTELQANYPNPFNPATSIAYSLERPSHVRLTVYDASGRKIRILVDEPQRADHHRMSWDGRDETGAPVASGVYFLKLEAGEFSQARKIVLVR